MLPPAMSCEADAGLKLLREEQVSSTSQLPPGSSVNIPYLSPSDLEMGMWCRTMAKALQKFKWTTPAALPLCTDAGTPYTRTVLVMLGCTASQPTSALSYNT